MPRSPLDVQMTVGGFKVSSQILGGSPMVDEAKGECACRYVSRGSDDG